MKSFLFLITVISFLVATGCGDNNVSGVQFSEKEIVHDVVDTVDNPQIIIEEIDTVTIWGDLVGGPSE